LVATGAVASGVVGASMTGVVTSGVVGMAVEVFFFMVSFHRKLLM
jgi:hypothetical protein